MAKGSKDIYDTYLGMTTSPIPYNLFKEILVKFNEGVSELLLEGEAFPMGYKLSDLQIVRKVRNPQKTQIDWGESYKEKKRLEAEEKPLYDKETGKGEPWLIYHMGRDYYQFYWSKKFCTVPNKMAYRFNATRGVKGNKTKLTELIGRDPLVSIRFKTYRDGHIS
jgi:hypothetical protein